MQCSNKHNTTHREWCNHVKQEPQEECGAGEEEEEDEEETGSGNDSHHDL